MHTGDLREGTAIPCAAGGYVTEDAVLVRQAQAPGPQARGAYDRLVARHRGWVHSALLRLLVDPGLADDVAQEAFLRAWLAIGRLEAPDRFRPWLRAIVIRTASNLHRARSTRDRYELAAPVPSGPPSPREVVETGQLLHRVLAELPYPHREVLVLRYLEELELAEIAARLDLGSSALKMRLKRARDAFLSLWEQHGGAGGRGATPLVQLRLGADRRSCPERVAA